MPAVLREHQLELLDANDETRALLFGTEDTGYLTLTPPAWASGEAQDGDVNRSQEDGRYFGRDLRGGASVGFEIGVITDLLSIGAGDAYRSNVDYVDALQSWWDDEQLRLRPWDLAVLRSCVAGQTWRAYGRPRRFDPVVGKLVQQGYTPVVCDFAVIDNRVYADQVESVDVPLVSLPDGGLIAPLAAPLTTTDTAEEERVAVIGGSKATWPWVEFRGPVLNPKVQIGPLTVGLATSIPGGMSVTVDPRPWSRGVTRNDGANYAGYLSYDTPVLRELTIRKGTYPVVYSGIDATGTSQCVVYWRNARSRP
jgi:hypothetical protein